MGVRAEARLLREREIEGEIQLSSVGEASKGGRRSVTVNAAESPLGWLLSRGLVSQRQFDAGEQLRSDWERGGLSPSVTMKWDAAPVGRQRGGEGQRVRVACLPEVRPQLRDVATIGRPRGLRNR